jgi:hypothetical protein
MHPSRLLADLRRAIGSSPYRTPARVHDSATKRRERPRTRVSDSLESLELARRGDAREPTSGEPEPAASDPTHFIVATGAAICAGLLLAVAMMMTFGAKEWAIHATSRAVTVVAAAATTSPGTTGLARDTLTARVYGGDATADEIRRLRSMCGDEGDTACVAQCDQRLEAMATEEP